MNTLLKKLFVSLAVLGGAGHAFAQLTQCTVPTINTAAGSFAMGWFNNVPTATVNQDGYWPNPATGGPNYWDTPATGADPALFSARGNPYTVGAGVTRTTTSSRVRLTRVDTNSLANAVTGNDYLEYSFTTKGTFDRPYFLDRVNWGRWDVAGEYPYQVGVRVSTSATFANPTTILQDQTITVPGNTDAYIPVDTRRTTPVALRPNTTYYVRVYYYNFTGTGGAGASTDDFQFGVTSACSDYGDGPNTYLTTQASAGAVEGISSTLRIGTVADADSGALTNAAANADDTNNTDDEDGVSTFPALSATSTSYSVSVNVTNTTGAAATLAGWIDFNGNGTFQSGEGRTASVPNGTAGNVTLSWTGLSGLVGGATTARFRLSDGSALTTSTPSGYQAGVGEVEDYQVTITPVVDLAMTKAQRQGTGGTFQTTALSVPSNQTIQYQLVASNNGPSAVTGATIADTVPSNVSGLSVVSATGAVGATTCSASFSGNVLAGTFSGPSSATCTVIIQGTVNAPGTFSNTATVAVPSGTTESNTANNTATVSTTVQGLTTPPCSTTFAGGLSAPFSIYPLNSDGTAGTALFDTAFAGTPATAATVAFARDPVTSRLYYIENTVTATSRVGYYDFATGQTVAAGTITKNTADQGAANNNFTRFGFNASGVGYASISATNSVYRMTTSPFSATFIGNTTGSLPLRLSGDFAITAANRAWLSANGEVYRVNLNDPALTTVKVVDTANTTANGVAFTPAGNLIVSDPSSSREVNLATLAFGESRPMTNQASTSGDLANCVVPALEPNLSVVKSVSPTGSVAPGAVLTYTITTTNTGNAVSVNTTFQDAIPTNTTYVLGSTTLNGATEADISGTMPFVTAGEIHSPVNGSTTYGDGIVSTTSPAVVTFQVRVNNPFPSTATSVTNQGFVEYDSGAADTRINVPSTPPGGGAGGTPTTVGGRDFGDAPDAGAGTATGNYQTTASDGGPSHTLTTALKLGSATTDADSGTLQNTAATADDLGATDDEDGLTTVPTVSSLAGQVATVPVTVANTTGADAYLTGFIDFNKDGDFADTGEKSATLTVANNATTANLSFTTPAGTTNGATYLRLRLSSTAVEVDTAEGAASSGEVEDYSVTLGAPDLSIAKSHTPASFTVGSTGTYSFTITNGGSAPSSGSITVTDTLPAGLTFVPGTPGGTNGANWSCSANAASPQTVTCTSSTAVVAAGTSTFTFSVNVTTGAAPGTNSLSNTASVVGGGDATSATSNTDTATVLSPNLTIGKTHTPATFVRGSTGTYTITVGNTGTAPTSGTLTVTDTLPSGLTIAAGTFMPTGANGSAWSCTASSQTVTCTSTTAIAVNGSSVFSFTVAVGAGVALPSVTNNVTVAGGNEATANAGNNTGSDVTPTAGTPDLTLTKSHTGTFTRGGTGVYTLRVDNIGNLATSGTITVTDTLPAGLTYVSSSGAGWTCSATGQTVTCTSSAAIPASGSSTFTLTVNVALSAPATVVNNASVAGGGEAAINNGNNSANNGAGDPTSTIGAADLTLAKSHTPASFTVGSPGTYSFTVTNSGESSSVGTITVTDTLPTGLTYAGPVTGTGWACSASSQTVTCTSTTVVSSTAGSNTSTFSFPVTVTAGVAVGTNSVTNVATVSGGGDTDTTNNSANGGNGDPTTVLSSNLTISKTHAPSSFIRGSTGTYTLTVGNSGTAATSGAITVVDTLPAGLTVPAGTFTPTGANGAAWSCTASGQSVTCTSSTALAIGGSSVFSFVVNVGSSAANTVQNIADVSNPNEATANTGNNRATDNTTVVGAPDLSITKSHSGSFTVGGTGTYSFTVANGGGSASSGLITVTDTLPAGLTYVGPATGAGWSCSASGQVVSCTSSTVVPITTGSNTSTFSFNVSVGAGTALPTVTNTASVVGGGDTTSATSNSDVAAISSTNLTLAKTHTPTTFVRGSTGSYTLTVSNIGNASTSGTTTVTDTLPAGLSVAGGTFTPAGTNGAAWSCTASGQTVTCTSTAAIAISGSSTFTFTVNVAADAGATTGNSVTNTATVANPNEATANVDAGNTASDPTPTATPVDLTLSKTSSTSFVKGSTGTYTLTVSNTGGTASAGTITVTDTLPTGLSYNAASGSGWTCSATGQVVTCTTLSSVAAGASAPPLTLTVNVLEAAPNSVSNTATVSGGGDATPANNSGSVTTPVTAVDLSLTKSHAGDFTVGGSGTYALSVANGGTAPSSGTVTVSDTLPIGLTVNGGGAGTVATAGTNAADWTCFSSASSPQVVTCSSTTPIPAGGNSLFGFSVAVGLNTAVGSNSVSNTASVSGGGDSNAANNTATDPTTVLSPDLTITKTHTPATFVRGSTGSYTVTVGNSGTAPTSGTLTATDTLPPGLTIPAGTFTPTGADGAAWSCTASGQTVTCTSTTAIAVSSSSTFTFTVNVGASTALPSVTNNVTVAGGNEATANTGNNSASDVTPTAGTPDLSISKTASGTFVRGGTGSYTLTVSNSGETATSGAITVSDTLPAGLLYRAATGTGWTCSASGQTVTCTRTVAVPAGGSAPPLTLTVNVLGTAPNSVSNTATVSGGGDTTPGNNSSTATTPVLGAGSLSLDKTVQNLTAGTAASATGNTGQPGDALEYCIAYSNPGQSPVTDAEITDDIPASTVATTAVADYGGQAIRWRVTAPTPTTQNLTAEVDADAGALSSLLSVTIGTIPPGGAGDICFRVSIE